MSPQLIELDTLSKQMSVYFFMTNTNKVCSDNLLPDTFLNILKEYFLTFVLFHLSKLIKQLLFDIINLITK